MIESGSFCYDLSPWTQVNKNERLTTLNSSQRKWTKLFLNIKTLIIWPRKFKVLFTPNPMNLCCSERKQSSSVVRTKLYPTKRIVGSYICGGEYCEVCINVNETSPFTSSTVAGDLIINHIFDCMKDVWSTIV